MVMRRLRSPQERKRARCLARSEQNPNAQQPMSNPFVDLLGDTLVKGDGSEQLSTASALSGKKTVGLYFSAHVRSATAKARACAQHPALAARQRMILVHTQR